MRQIQRVLLVDDDDISIFLNMHVISKMRLQHIEVRSNGEEALEYLRKCESEGKVWPDLILLDLYMPYMDGSEFLKEFYKLTYEKKYETKILVVSTIKATEEQGNICRNFGVEFIEKPLSQAKITPHFQKRTVVVH